MSDNLTNGLERARDIQRALDNVYERPYFIHSHFGDIAVIWNVYKMVDDDLGKRPVQVGGMAIPYRELNDERVSFNYFELAIKSLQGNIDAYEQKEGLTS